MVANRAKTTINAFILIYPVPHLSTLSNFPFICTSTLSGHFSATYCENVGYTWTANLNKHLSSVAFLCQNVSGLIYSGVSPLCFPELGVC